ncbi:MAG: hypothetical protein HeimC3_08040 [Candidatus Heimdallarchaeota archaeon LC_3]|nr:MAG: hypothetical protein HeimC3_08040 [Candidatus Heimdallarchaeota archaeon LC_3]
MYTSVYDQKETKIMEEVNSKKVSTIKVILSTIKMNLIIIKRYKANLAGGLLEMAIIALVFGLFAGAMEFKTSGFSHLTSDQIFIFFLGAIILIVFNGTALWIPVRTIQRDLYNGVLEYLYFNPSSRYGYFVGNVLADGIIKFFFLFLPIFSIMLIIINIKIQSIIAIFAVTLVVLATLMSLGILISLAAILWKDIGGLIGILGLLFQFLSGAFFPIQTFPEPVQVLAYLLPYTFAFDLVRYFSFEGNWVTIFPLEVEIAILIFYAILYIALSAWLLKKVERHAKNKGLHLI